jgi:hypothetical protein
MIMGNIANITYIKIVLRREERRSFQSRSSPRSATPTDSRSLRSLANSRALASRFAGFYNPRTDACSHLLSSPVGMTGNLHLRAPAALGDNGHLHVAG